MPKFIMLFSAIDFTRILKPSAIQKMIPSHFFFTDFVKTFRTPFSGAAVNGEKCKMRGVLHKQLSCKKLFCNAFSEKPRKLFIKEFIFK